MNDRLDVNPTDLPQATITTREQAVAWVEELTQEMLKWREECNKVYPNETQAVTVQRQRRAMWTFLNKQGQVVGSLKTLMLVGILPERAYKEMNQRAINTLAPTIVGRT